MDVKVSIVAGHGRLDAIDPCKTQGVAIVATDLASLVCGIRTFDSFVIGPHR